MLKNWEIVEVATDKFTEIHESYSGDTIADSKTIRRPFKFQSNFFVSTGGVSGRGSTPHEECYQIVPREQYQGEARWYGEKLRDYTGNFEDWAAQRRDQPKGFYHGMLIKRGKTERVLVGPPLVFLPKEGSIGSKQLELM